MQSNSNLCKNYQGKYTFQPLPDIKNVQWLEEMGDMTETTVNGLNKGSFLWLDAQNGQWRDFHNDQWLEEMGDMIESTVKGLNKDFCRCV